MPEPLTFLMGKHPAPLPGDLLYCKNHMWCRPGADGVHTFGFTAYAVRLMQDVYFLEWRIDPGLVTLKQEIGYIETQKATSGLYAPLAGPDHSIQRGTARRPVHDQRRQLRQRLALRVRPASLIDTLDADGVLSRTSKPRWDADPADDQGPVEQVRRR